ncbi:VWA domain-containing protein [Microbaculum marinisediminis]|uniref:VWA domain-containing protein n=1 Tax=Microbaculum marinisediminis TaxID=2931392 RepID=A0AAW5R6P1_9HYPH|nr:VWA domain-containing protein [Microbaculum sp. A6E488]MCT8974299.1 VWA domain-containing protein [Microbaculum sp. A6E488]
MSFGFPLAFLVLPLPLLVWWLVPPRRERVPALRFPFFRQIVSAVDAVPRSGAVILSRTRLQMIAAIVCWCLVVLALARPERVGMPIEITKAARDVVLAIDISGSMDARDFIAPGGERKQRLEAVRQVVRTFVEGREGDRMALIVFGSKAYVQAPLTEDLETIIDMLNRTEVGMAGPHTALGDAIGLSIRTFETSDIDQRLLILLSDGSDTSSRMSPVNAAEIAADKGVEIYTVGVGDPEATGENRVDLATLEEIANRTGGAFFFAEDETALSEVYNRIDELAPREVETLSYRPRRSLAYIPLAVAALVGLGVVVLLHCGSRRRVAA